MAAGMALARPDSSSGLAATLAGWGLAGGAPVVVLVGGAGDMVGTDLERTAAAVDRAVVPAVVASGAVLVDGGTDAGVIRLAGEARRRGPGAFPHVGVVPARQVQLPQEDMPPQARMQEDHSHMLVVPGERWGDETPWLFDAAELMAGARPIVTVVLNGGRIARAELDESVRRGHRAIVVAGTGRMADRVAAVSAGDPDLPADDALAADRALVGTGLVGVVRYDEHERLRTAIEDALTRQDHDRGTSMTQAPPAAAATRRSYEEEMRALIGERELSDEQRVFLRSRWLGQVTYMSDRAREAKSRYYSFRLATVVGGVIVPALISISLAGAGRFDPDIDFVLRVVTFVVSAIVAITASVEGFFRFGDRWRHYRVNAEELKSEGWQYLTRTGPYARQSDGREADPDAAFGMFAERVEQILRNDVEGFMANMPKHTPVEKHDIFTKV